MPAHGYPAVYSFASLPLYLLVNALVLENEVDTMLSLDLFWTYFRLLHLNRILNRVIRIAVIVTTGCHFYLVARQKVYFDATGFGCYNQEQVLLRCVHDFEILFFFPFKDFLSSRNTENPLNTQHLFPTRFLPSFPVPILEAHQNTPRHRRLATGR